MCNSYRIRPARRGEHSIADRIADAAERLKSELVRKSDRGVVMLADGRVEVMRWGFQRSFNPSINNARSDKLEAGIWREAFHERRCVIPMSLFYEWGANQNGGGRGKQAYEFHDPADDYLWAAGIWEDGEGEMGPCYTMVTTAPSLLMAPIHERMPALLRPEEMHEFLAGTGHWDFQPFSGRLVVTPCESPLTKRRPPPESQPELF